MKPRSVFHLISYVLMFLGFAMGLCWGVSYVMEDPWETQRGMALSFAAVIIVGFSVWSLTRHPPELSVRDGIGVVTFGWLSASLAGSLPFMLCDAVPSFVDAFFETVSGLTTTGASIIADPDNTPYGILFWRALTHFMGGMGILVFCVAILPLVGTGGMQLYRAEASGVSRDRLTPRIATTAKLLWVIYIGMNVVLTILLRFGGMSWFDALCHSFAAVATGGFSTRTESIAAFDSHYIEVVLVAFMFLSAVNFTLHFRALRGKPLAYFRDTEFRFYFGWWLASCVAVGLIIANAQHIPLVTAMRHAVFGVTSLLTTTGFFTMDFDTWPFSAKIILVFCMLIGGCAGSTCGAMKQVRVLVVLKRIAREAWLFIHPQAVVPVRLGHQIVDNSTAASITTFVTLYLIFYAGAALAMSFFVDVETAFTATAGCLGGVGPGFSMAGATEAYDVFPTPAKCILILSMLLGRLEFYTLLVVLLPRFWRR